MFRCIAGLHIGGRTNRSGCSRLTRIRQGRRLPERCSKFTPDRCKHSQDIRFAGNVGLLSERVATIFFRFLLQHFRPGNIVNADVSAGGPKRDGDSLANPEFAPVTMAV